MSININGNLLSSGFTTNSNILNTDVITNGLLLWYDAGNTYSYPPSAPGNYYDCGYGCQYYASDPGCSSCSTRILDMSGNALDGTATAMSVSYNTTTGGGALYFNGSTYKVLMNGLRAKCTTSITWNLWMNHTTNVTEAEGIFGNLRTVLYLYTGATYYSLQYQCYFSDFSITGPSINNLSNNVWYNITLVEDYSGGNTTITAYLNGTYYSTYNGTGKYPIYYAGAEFYLGYDNSAAQYRYGGYIGPFMVYDRALSAQEVAQNYNAIKPRYGI